ncbi:MAG TPA: FHA domain-containing protein [Myxococcota bacterium]|nr:FHA domain-containing protein [Myxococcota bacterium]
MPTWITLADGSRRGPYQEPLLHVGTDGRCNLVLPQGAGVRAVHATITPGNGTWTIAPGEAGAAIFLEEGPGRVRRLSTSTALRPGDRVRLGTTSGPTLAMDDGTQGKPVLAPPAPAPLPTVGAGAAPSYSSPPARPSSSRNRMPTADAISAEIARRAEVEAMRQAPVQDVARFWHRYRSGTLMRPDVLVGAGISLLTALCGLCGGGGASFWYVWQKFLHG